MSNRETRYYYKQHHSNWEQIQGDAAPLEFYLPAPTKLPHTGPGLPQPGNTNGLTREVKLEIKSVMNATASCP